MAKDIAIRSISPVVPKRKPDLYKKSHRSRRGRQKPQVFVPLTMAALPTLIVSFTLPTPWLFLVSLPALITFGVLSLVHGPDDSWYELRSDCNTDSLKRVKSVKKKKVFELERYGTVRDRFSDGYRSSSSRSMTEEEASKLNYQSASYEIVEVKKEPSRLGIFDPTILFRKKLVSHEVSYDAKTDVYREFRFYSSLFRDEEVIREWYGPRKLFSDSLDILRSEA